MNNVNMQDRNISRIEKLSDVPADVPSSKFLTDLIQRLKLSWAAGIAANDANNFVFKPEVMMMLNKVIPILYSEPNVLNIAVNCDQGARLTIVGDTHGQFYDLLSIFESNGYPSNTNIYIFNGDFVDRGSFSFQVIFLLLCFKVTFPKGVYLLRGNHESEQMNMTYGFTDEILAKYDSDVLRTFWTVFTCLPLAAIVNQSQKLTKYRVFVSHGGLVSPDKFSKLLKLERAQFRKLSKDEKEIVLDVLWSDPQDQNGLRKNSARGAGMRFGPDVTRNFLQSLNLDLLVRSHQIKQNGFAYAHDNLCLTIFSCPNYCDRHNNKGSYLVFSNKTERPAIKQFMAVEHPPLPFRIFSSKL